MTSKLTGCTAVLPTRHSGVAAFDAMANTSLLTRRQSGRCCSGRSVRPLTTPTAVVEASWLTYGDERAMSCMLR
jgi:hypothetical protein